MLNRLTRNMIIALSRVKVVDSLPGRLLLSIDGLENIRYFFNENERISLNYDFYRNYGITNLEITPQNSRVLIEYDPSVLREKQIFDLVERFKEIFIEKVISRGKTISSELFEEIKAILKNEGYYR